MSEPQIVNTLRSKRDEIEKAIAGYEKVLDLARLDLAHVNATLTIFERVNDTRDVKAYMDTGRLFPRGQIVKLCRAALEAEGPLDTRQLALQVAAATGLDGSDPMLRKALAYRIVQAMTLAWRRGKVGSEGKVGGVRVWTSHHQRFEHDEK